MGGSGAGQRATTATGWAVGDGRVRAALGAAIALGLTLTACAPTTSATTAEPQPTATTATETPAPAEEVQPVVEETPVPTFAVGDVIDPSQAEFLPENQVAFTLMSGETVVVDKDQRLPDSVRNEVGILVGQAMRADYKTQASIFEKQVRPKIREIQKATGVVVGYTVYSSGIYGSAWTVVIPGEPDAIIGADMKANKYANLHKTPEDALAYADTVIARIQYPGKYEVAVMQ